MMDLTEYVANMLKGATESELKSVIENGVEIEDSDICESIENEFVSQAKELLRLIENDK